MKVATHDELVFDVSVVIVSLNTERVLKECLQCLKRESDGLRVETFIVDNGSVDGSLAMVKSEFPEVHVIASPEKPRLRPRE